MQYKHNAHIHLKSYRTCTLKNNSYFTQYDPPVSHKAILLYF